MQAITGRASGLEPSRMLSLSPETVPFSTDTADRVSGSWGKRELIWCPTMEDSIAAIFIMAGFAYWTLPEVSKMAIPQLEFSRAMFLI